MFNKNNLATNFRVDMSFKDMREKMPKLFRHKTFSLFLNRIKNLMNHYQIQNCIKQSKNIATLTLFNGKSF